MRMPDGNAAIRRTGTFRVPLPYGFRVGLRGSLRTAPAAQTAVKKGSAVAGATFRSPNRAGIGSNSRPALVKPRLTLPDTPAGSGVYSRAEARANSEAACGAARIGTEPLDQGLGALDRRELLLHVAQPEEILLVGLAAQGLLCRFEFLM